MDANNIVVDLPTLDIPADVLVDMPTLDILGFEVEDILVHCLEAAAVGSPACLMLVCRIPAAVGILIRPSLFLGFVLMTPSNNSDLTQNPANFCISPADNAWLFCSETPFCKPCICAYPD